MPPAAQRTAVKKKKTAEEEELVLPDDDDGNETRKGLEHFKGAASSIRGGIRLENIGLASRRGDAANGLGATLLDHIRAKRGDFGEPNTFTSRFVVVSKLGKKMKAGSEDMRQMGLEYENKFEEMTADKRLSQITGVLLMFDKTCIHFIEAPPDAMFDILNLIASHHSCGWLEAKSSKVLLSKFVPSPAFMSYTYEIVSVTTTQTGEYSTSESFETAAGGCISNLALLGQDMMVTKTFPGNDSAARAFIPSESMIEYLLKGKGVESFMAHHAAQSTTFDLVMEGERVWPMAERMYPYD